MSVDPQQWLDQTLAGLPQGVTVGSRYIPREEWLRQNPDWQGNPRMLPALVPVDGHTEQTRDWVTKNPAWLEGKFNAETHTPAQQDRDRNLMVSTGGVASYDSRDIIEKPLGTGFRYHTGGQIDRNVKLKDRKAWLDLAEEQNQQTFMFDRGDKGYTARADLEQPAATPKPRTGWKLLVDDIGDAAFRGYAGATSSTLGRPERFSEFMFGRFGQPFTPQGRAQTKMALDLGRDVVNNVRSGEAGLLGKVLGLLPDPVLNKLPLVANLAGGVLGDAIGLFPARLAWRINPGDLLQTQIMPRAAEALGVPDPWHAQGEMGRTSTYDPGTDPVLKAKWRDPRWLGRDMRESGFALKPTVALAAAAMGLGSGNVGALDWEEGFRRPGYQAMAASSDDPTKTENLALALIAPLTGGSSRLLPWDQFHNERPDVSREKYDSYRAYQRGETDITPEADFSILGGMIRGTASNIDGEPELQMVGGRVTPMGVAAALGTGIGSAALLSNWLNTGNPVDFSQTRDTVMTKFNQFRRGK